MSDNNEKMSLLTAETDFGLSLLRESGVNGSFVFSPLSIALALSLVHAGAKGTTRTQIGNALVKGAKDEEVQQQFMSISKAFTSPANGVEVDLANRMFIRNGFPIEPTYLETIKKNFEALAQNLDFSNKAASAKVMNDFVDQITKGKIKNLVQEGSITPDAVAFLINALYIKADWKKPFLKTMTKEGDFFEAPAKTRKVEYMSDTNVYHDYTETDEVQVLSLKYKDESYAFNIFLPKKQFGLDKFRAELTGEKIQTILGQLQKTYMKIKIPKMKLESELALVPTLQKLGITDVFGSKADLSGIANNLYVSEVKHKAMIEMDEEGVVAAAATYVGIRSRSRPMAPPMPTIFDADHPFLYVDEEGTTASASTYAKAVPKMLRQMQNFHTDHPFVYVLTKDNHVVFLGTFA